MQYGNGDEEWSTLLSISPTLTGEAVDQFVKQHYNKPRC